MREADHHVEIRPYESRDAGATPRIFDEAVAVSASADYTPEQIRAWQGMRPATPPQWNRSMRGRESYVALIGGKVAGFSDLAQDGHIHMLFVDPRFGGRGVGRALLTFLEACAVGRGLSRLSADVSLTARPLFERMGFEVVEEQRVRVGGQVLTNFQMAKRTALPSSQ